MNIKDDKNIISQVGDLDYKFCDLFDLSEIQGIQDAFSLATGVASIITEIDGTPITKPSNFSYFCNTLIRKNVNGIKNCMLSDSIIGSPKKDGPRIQRCLSCGLIDGGASIMVGGKHIANWIIGQVLDKEYNIDEIFSYTDEIGVDRNIVAIALDQVTCMTLKQFTDICNFLFLTTQQLSTLAINNFVQANEIRKRRIAEQEIKKLNSELKKKVLERTYQLENINAELEKTNVMLNKKGLEYQNAEVKIKKMNSELELRIIERTNLLEKINIKLEETNSNLNNEIIDRIKIEEALKESKSRLISAQLMAHVGNWELDLVSKNIWASEEAFNIYGDEYALQNVSMDFLKERASLEYREYLHKALIGLITKNEKYDVEFKIHNSKTGKERVVHSKAILIVDQDGNAFKVVGTIQDITASKRKQDEIKFLSYHDQLTGLYNRRFYEEELKKFDTKRNLPITIVMGDVNGLKLINDTFGHAMGDKLLKKVTEVLRSGCRTDDIIARLGGDEFVILLPKTDEFETKKIIKRIADLSLNSKVCSLGISISFGYKTKNIVGEKIEEVFKNAEDYMYKRKLFKSVSIRGDTINAIICTLNEKNKREEQHAHRVSDLCKSMGDALGLPEYEIEELKSVGLLHDIGKIAIDENILNKPGKLTDEEWKEIKRHPEIGYRILNTVKDMSDMAAYVLAHHERWDGKGYPKGLKKNEIPLVSRIITIADSYDAMTSDRSYRNALTKEASIHELRKNAGTQFDPELVSVFIEKILG